MNGIMLFVLLLAGVLGVVLQPLFSRRGNLPLPRGMAGDPWTELSAHRDSLLLQLKEWQLESGQEAGGAAIQAGMEQELATVLARLDRLGQPVVGGQQEKNSQEERVRTPMDMGWAVALLVLLVVLTGGLYVGLGKPTALSTNRAIQMPEQAEFQSAVERLAERLKQEPDNSAGWLKLARSQAMLGNNAGAIAAYTHILTRPGDHEEAAMGLAALQVQSEVAEQVKQGVVTLEALLAKKPDLPDALWLLGAVAAREGDYPRALHLWQRLLPLLPARSEAYNTVEGAIAEAKAQSAAPQ